MTCVGRHVYLGIASAHEGRRASVSLLHVFCVNGALCTGTILARGGMAFLAVHCRTSWGMDVRVAKLLLLLLSAIVGCIAALRVDR